MKTQADFDEPNSVHMATIIFGLLTAAVTAILLMFVVPFHMWAHDEGQYGQSARRILEGELPHRDFHEMYTGALSYFNAAIFWLVGEDLGALRYGMVLFSIPAMLAMYDILVRLTGLRLLSSVATISAMFLSVGMTHAATPTTYLSFLAVLSAWALIRYIDAPHWEWIVLAGMLAGLGFTIKLTGLYNIAMVGLALTYLETSDDASSERRQSGLMDRVTSIAVALAGLACVVLLIKKLVSLDMMAFFVLPMLWVCLPLAMKRHPVSVKVLLKRYSLLAIGVLIPIVVFLVPFAISGSLSSLYEGLIVLPQKRLGTSASYAPPPVWTAIFAIPLALCCLPGSNRWVWLRVPQIALAAVVLWLIVASVDRSLTTLEAGYVAGIVNSWRWLPHLMLPLLIYWELRFAVQTPVFSSRCYVLASSLALFWLNQFPFVSPIYFFFCMPQVVLAMIAGARISGEIVVRSSEGSIAQSAGRRYVLIAGGCVAAFGLYGGWRYQHEGIFREFFTGKSEFDELSGLQITQDLVVTYNTIRDRLDRQLSPDQTIIAGPDAPDIYFFTGRRNLTPVMYEMFAEEESFGSQVKELANRNEVGGFVVNLVPQFSPLWSDELSQNLLGRCQQGGKYGRFIVAIKGPAAEAPYQADTER